MIAKIDTYLLNKAEDGCEVLYNRFGWLPPKVGLFFMYCYILIAVYKTAQKYPLYTIYDFFITGITLPFMFMWALLLNYLWQLDKGVTVCENLKVTRWLIIGLLAIQFLASLILVYRGETSIIEAIKGFTLAIFGTSLYAFSVYRRPPKKRKEKKAKKNLLPSIFSPST